MSKSGKSRSAMKYDFVAIPKALNKRVMEFIEQHPEEHFKSKSHFAQVAIEDELKKLGETSSS